MTPISPLKRPRTLTEQAADAIRTRIVTGDFQLGEALSEITLAAELGVSKTPVREAFLQLKNEGLVDIQPQRGTFVFQMTPEQTRDLTVLRELLEVKALRIAFETDVKALAGVLDAVVAAMARAAATADFRTYRELDQDFHQRIIAASRNEFIETAYSGIAFRVQALRNRLSLQPPQNDRSLREHIAMADFRTYRELDQEFHQRIIAASRNEFIETAYSGIAFRVQALRNRLSLQPPQNDRSLREHIAMARFVAAGDVESAAATLLEHIRVRAGDYMVVAKDARNDMATIRPLLVVRSRHGAIGR